MFNRSLRAVHEFQADEGCLRTGISICNYQSLLLNQVFKSNIFTLPNSFSNPTLIKKRMIMMSKERSGELANLKLLIVFPVAAFLLFTFSSFTGLTGAGIVQSEIIQTAPSPTQQMNGTDNILPEQPEQVISESPIEENAPTEVFIVVEEMPSYPSGDAEMMNFINRNVTYP